MNPEAAEYLKKILQKDPNDLTQSDKDFLKARWQYVGKNSRQKFESFLTESDKKTKKNIPQVPTKPTEAVEEDEEATDTIVDPNAPVETEEVDDDEVIE